MELEYAYTEPVREFARKRGFSPTKVYRWIASGEIESFIEGHRRHIVVSSYDRLVRRRVAEQGSVKLASSNPKARARLPAAPEEPAPGQPPAEQHRSVVVTAPSKRRGRGRSS
jgi:hypothetical protein